MPLSLSITAAIIMAQAVPWPPQTLARKNFHVLRLLRTIVIAVSNVPNQVRSYQGVSTPLAEDHSVAYSWKLFIGDTQKYQNASLHIPMAIGIEAFRLAKKELAQQNVTKFIVTGASKRGWAAWLTALSDPDVDAIIPGCF